MNTKEWLAQNNYPEVLKKIHRVENGWEKKGTGTHRNWADVLAGHEDGKPREVEGVKFPVLRAARERKGWAITEGCVCHNPNEKMPSVIPQKRWEKFKGHSHNMEEKTL